MLWSFRSLLQNKDISVKGLALLKTSASKVGGNTNLNCSHSITALSSSEPVIVQKFVKESNLKSKVVETASKFAPKTWKNTQCECMQQSVLQSGGNLIPIDFKMFRMGCVRLLILEQSEIASAKPVCLQKNAWLCNCDLCCESIMHSNKFHTFPMQFSVAQNYKAHPQCKRCVWVFLKEQ